MAEIPENRIYYQGRMATVIARRYRRWIIRKWIFKKFNEETKIFDWARHEQSGKEVVEGGGNAARNVPEHVVELAEVGECY